MKKEKVLTWRQKWCHAHFKAKRMPIEERIILLTFMVMLVWLGFLLWLMQPIVDDYTQNPHEYQRFWLGFMQFVCALISAILSYATVYVVYFIKYFFFANGEDN